VNFVLWKLNSLLRGDKFSGKPGEKHPMNDTAVPKNLLSQQSSRKREWGTEREASPLSSLHRQPSGYSVFFSRLAIVLTILFWAMYVTSVVIRQLIDGPQSYQFTMEVVGYLIVTTFLTFSALVYLITRQGALQRFSKHIRVPRAIIDRHFSTKQSSITVLIPSFREETQVIRKTVLSAALQEYPDIRVALLIDDNPTTVRPEDEARLQATRALVDEIEKLLSGPYERFSRALAQFKEKHRKNTTAEKDTIPKIAEQYIWAASWLDTLAEKEVIEDHVDEFFADHVLRELAKDLNLVAEALLISHKEGAQLSSERVLQLYHRLTWIFGAKLQVFERKRYISLSHELNKAMNLNSYIGLMGGAYQQEQTPEGIVLVPTTEPDGASLIIPDSEFVLTLDADSILLREYCLRLVYFLEQADNADVAVAQTPYSSFRGAPTRLTTFWSHDRYSAYYSSGHEPLWRYFLGGGERRDTQTCPGGYC
jgi:cellulose synthase/poly-beta-1,6-N-acetylglucosamine synthase-like glycosyltransferase